MANPAPLVAALRAKLGLSRKTFSRLAGFSERTIAGWEAGRPANEAGLRRLKELDRLRDRLAGVVAADAIPGWLEAPNPAFGGLKPLEVIERGRPTGCGGCSSTSSPASRADRPDPARLDRSPAGRYPGGGRWKSYRRYTSFGRPASSQVYGYGPTCPSRTAASASTGTPARRARSQNA